MSDHPTARGPMKLALNIFGVAVLIAILVGILIPTGARCGPTAEVSITRSTMSQACIALLLYNQEYSQLPSETDNAMLVQILEGDNPRKLCFYSFDHKKFKTGQFMDGWGKPLLFKSATTGLLIRSAGKDGRYYTKDDITQAVQVHPTESPSTLK